MEKKQGCAEVHKVGMPHAGDLRINAYCMEPCLRDGAPGHGFQGC